MKRSIDIKNAATGTYTVRATCPGCLPYVNTATFTATGVGTELTCSSCTLNGASGRELRNPFKLRVLDKVTGEPVAGYGVAYSIISFTDKYGITISSAHPHGASLRVFNAVSDIYGFSRAYLKLGSEEGTYIVRARCETCLSGQEQIAEGIARRRHIIIEAKKTTLADPEDTPVVQITQVVLPNDARSFTTSDGENRVVLQAKLLPASLDQNLIHWNTEDDPDDFITSGIAQMEESYGPSNALRMRLTSVGGGVPVASAGRPLPLRYVVTAEATIPGKVVIPSMRTVRQDVIDKCRQEYIDYGVGLRAEVTRSKFTLGLHEEYANPKRIKDCYAYIYPGFQAQKVEKLRAAGHQVKVTSGYRSPRYNAIYSSTNSTHLFGEAVDVNPIASELNIEGWKTLWGDNANAGCPKTLEMRRSDGTVGVMRWCNGTQTERKGPDIPSGVIPGTAEYDSAVYGIATCIHLGNSAKSLENEHD